MARKSQDSDREKRRTRPLRGRHGSEDAGRRLFVGNLPFSVTTERLEQAFAQFGIINSRFIIDRETGRKTGVAFVEMETVEMAASAVAALDGALIDGKVLDVHPEDGGRRSAWKLLGYTYGLPKNERAASEPGEVQEDYELPVIDPDVIEKAEVLAAATTTTSQVETFGLDELLKSKEAEEAFSAALAAESAAHLIRTARVSARLTQAELAARLNTKQSRIAELEGGSKLGPSISLIARIALACGYRLKMDLEKL